MPAFYYSRVLNVFDCVQKNCQQKFFSESNEWGGGVELGPLLLSILSVPEYYLQSAFHAVHGVSSIDERQCIQSFHEVMCIINFKIRFAVQFR